MSTYPLVSLWELGNLTVRGPVHQVVEEAIGPRGRLAYVQLYMPFVKGMDEHVPLVARPHLLTYMLGEQYIWTNQKFKKVWDKVQTQRTRQELMEMANPSVAFEARFEVVVTGRDLSFLSVFDHASIAQAVVDDQLLIKVRRNLW